MGHGTQSRWRKSYGTNSHESARENKRRTKIGCDNVNNNIIDDILMIHPEAKEKKEGFPNIGHRKDRLPFSDTVRKIEEAWYFYDTELYKLPSKKDIIKFGSGNPLDYKAFPLCIKNLKEYLNKKMYTYPAAAGDEELRTILKDYLVQEGFSSKLSYENIIITNSTTNGFYLILKAIFRPYDAIIMTAPNYGLFAFMPERENISVHTIPLRKENNYNIDPKELEEIIHSVNQELKGKYQNLGYSPKVRAFLNINPHNPLGTVLSDQEEDLLKEIGSVCQKNNVFIIDDLIYRDLSYDRDHLAKPIGTISEYFDATISLFGLSKSYGLAQTRSGFIVANEVVIRMIRDQVFASMDSASIIPAVLLSGAFQASQERKTEYEKYFSPLINQYLLQRDICIAMVDGIDSIKDSKNYSKIIKIFKKRFRKEELSDILEGIPYAKVVLKPESGFFLLIDFTELKKQGMIKSEKELLKLLYEKCGIKFLVGQSFNWPYEDEIIMRITYALDMNQIIDAMKEINQIMREV